MTGMGLLSKLGSDPNRRMLSKLQKFVDQITALEPEYEALADDELRAKTVEFRERLSW